MNWTELKYKIKHKWMRSRLVPIRVFCFHQVSDEFDESTMDRVDWLQTNEFKKRVQSLREQGYRFISLVEAHEHIKHDFIRTRKYAVLTADDGWASLKNILPWLNEQQIPITLFLNPAYLDGKHFRERDTEKYLTEEEVLNLHKQYPLLTIGSHGWEHINAREQDEHDFGDGLARSLSYLCKLPNYIPYFAYPWGRRTYMTNKMLLDNKITPVFIEGQMNITNEPFIHRELL